MNILRAMVFLCANLCALQATAADREWTDYQRLLEATRLDKFYGTPAARRDKVRMFGTVKPNNAAIPAEDVVFTVVHKDGTKRITVDRQGRFDPLIDPAWVKDNPKVLTNMPAGEKAQFAFAIEPVVPAGTQFGYAALMAGVRQSNVLLKEQAGMMRFFLPNFTGIEIRFARGQAASARIGSAVVAADARGVLRLELDERLIAANAQVSLSHVPQAYDFIVD